MIAGSQLNWEPMEGRYRVSLTLGGMPVLQGWWADRATADRKFTTWIGQYGSRAGARVTLTDEETGDLLTSWPDEA
ncbi:hypothetical protein [Streptomyces sp. 3214.6]|uniref:hypothetical protein n=1 Tax=Streptomyces sp. 3214.6 TaxID=1882757 RepID=UPI00090BC74C|nr:hypothetical protein [Streptomyces sp. 3214.6]SHI69092.1 hypothetical protein SAMN05444521_8249 [Streptomyces sp. 3214.6]